VLSDGAANYTPGISERRSGVTTYQHAGLKNTSVQTAASQAITASRTYDAFGNVVATSGTFKGPFGYGGPFGYQEDGDSGLKLLGHRYYDPSTGRFLTRDPIKDGRNWFAYCENNPLNNVDPTGLWIETFLDAVSFGSSVVDFVKDPSVANFGWVLADGAALVLPIVPGTGVVRGGTRGVDEAVQAAHRRKRQSKGSPKRTNDKHTKPRPGRPTEKKKQKPDWNPSKPKGQPTQRPSGSHSGGTVPGGYWDPENKKWN